MVAIACPSDSTVCRSVTFEPQRFASSIAYGMASSETSEPSSGTSTLSNMFQYLLRFTLSQREESLSSPSKGEGTSFPPLPLGEGWGEGVKHPVQRTGRVGL